VIERNELERTGVVLSLGVVSDNGALAAIRYQESRQLPEDDDAALRRARSFFEGMATTASGPTVNADAILAMASTEAPMDAIEAFRRVAPDARVSDALATVTRLIDRVLQRKASKSEAAQLEELFRRLSVVTLQQAEAAINEGHGGGRTWTIEPAL
jgi:hypothetical protein